jgi:gliding motility-associated-like protein
MLLTNNVLSPPNEHPWRLGPSSPSALGDQQSVGLLGVIFTGDQIGFVYRQNNSSNAQINYIENFNLPSNTDLWIELKKTCTFGFRLSVFDTPLMNNTPLAVETTNFVNISVPLNALYIANANGNGALTEQNDLLDDYRIELLPNAVIDFQHSITPATCTTPGLLSIDGISGGIPPYSISFNGTISSVPTYTFENGSSVAVSVTDNSGCSANANIDLPSPTGIGSLEFPNVFTPNKDNTNEKWFVTGNCVKSFSCVILDRWGNEVITLTSLDQSWDGTFKSKNCSDGIYFYQATAEFSSGQKTDYHGNISLLR